MTPLVSPWVADAAPPRYRLEGDRVRLEGSINRPSGTTQNFYTLPVGYRPTATLHYSITATNAFGRMTVGVAGGLNVVSGVVTGTTALSGITFPIS